MNCFTKEDFPKRWKISVIRNSVRLHDTPVRLAHFLPLLSIRIHFTKNGRRWYSEDTGAHREWELQPHPDTHQPNGIQARRSSSSWERWTSLTLRSREGKRIDRRRERKRQTNVAEWRWRGCNGKRGVCIDWYAPNYVANSRCGGFWQGPVYIRKQLIISVLALKLNNNTYYSTTV